LGRRGAKPESELPATPRQRLDLWIWHARFVRTRSDAADLIRSGHVRVNGMRQTQAGYAIKLGDVLTLALISRTLLVRVSGMVERRGSAHEANTLYALLEPGF
jgi:ribosome-associated heat shock protein Hsp15